MAKRRSRASKPQLEQNVMEYHAGSAADLVDCSAGLTVINRKQYHQTKSYKPLAYHVRAQCITTGSDADPIKFYTAANSWTTKNAVTMLGRQYATQLKSSGITKSMLPRYGKELRLALRTNVDYTHSSGSDGDQDAYLASTAIQPVDSDGNGVMQAYTNTSGDSVTFLTTNDLTTISIPETGVNVAPETVVLSLTGTSDHDANDFVVIPEYLGARRNASVEDLNVDLPHDDSLMLRIGAASAENLDDILESTERFGEDRPYDENGANELVLQGALMAAGDYCSFVAPLGLVRVIGNTDSKYIFTVTAITEM